MENVLSAWITIKGPFGNKKVEPGYVLRPWESIDHIQSQAPHQNEIESAARHFGMDVADFIEWAGHCLNIPPCLKCEMSKRVLYRMNEIGWLRGVALLWHIRYGDRGIPHNSSLQKEIK